jgi:UDP-N-acetylglucosamine 1-carboxyvinyltransferase
MHIAELRRMGAKIEEKGDLVHITGVEHLKPAQVMATDLRASVSLILAGLATKGETIIDRVYHLDRGYEKIEEKLSLVGAKITRIA